MSIDALNNELEKLDEAYVYQTPADSSTLTQLDYLAANVGKVAINKYGKPVKGSIVLSGNMYIEKRSGDWIVTVVSARSISEIEFSKEELQVLKRIKV